MLLCCELCHTVHTVSEEVLLTKTVLCPCGSISWELREEGEVLDFPRKDTGEHDELGA